MQTILQQPTSPNGTLSNLMYVVSSSNADFQPQFRYIAQVLFSGSSEILFEEKIFPNSASSGVFDLAHIYNDYLDLNVNLNSLTTYDNSPNKFVNFYGSLPFQVQFGEEYGTSISSSTTEYYSQSTSNIIDVVASKVNPDNGSYNFGENYFNEVPALTSYPFYQASSFNVNEISNMKVIDIEDYETLQVLNDANTSGYAMIYYIITTYDSNGNVLVNQINNSPQPPGNALLSVPVGPQNFIDRGGIYKTMFEDPLLSYYKITTVSNNPTTSFKIYWYKINTECSDYKTRFIWLNDLGGWDFFNIYLYDNKSTSVKRQDYTQNFANYSGRNPQYNIESRGKTNYYTTYQDDFKIVSNWLTTEKADWLNGIFESRKVYVSNKYISVNIKNANYAWKTNPKGQKVFQYDFNYEYSNKRQPR